MQIVIVNFLVWMIHRFCPEAFVDVVEVIAEIIGNIGRDTFVDDVAGLKIYS